MKVKRLLNIIILVLLILLFAILISKRAGDIHSINYCTGLAKLQEAYDIEYNLDKKIVENGIYPDFYGGSYVDENWHVVVCLTDDSEASKAIISKEILNVPVIYKKVDCSLNGLLESKRLIEQNRDPVISSVSIDIKENKVNVHLVNIDSRIIGYIYGIVDKKIINIEKAVPVLNPFAQNHSAE